ncbi:hypothetical protein CH289_18910 [Rhodococcus sp. RS1C4]|uniref:sigma-70 family RNA polymerase sigma factor n=1 Tax=Rhodococcus sp. 114MFTsu3.1 TaxID=1172184 RepID=UPI00037E6978|nr:MULTISPECIES: sigma-70 family RNA polymerase sigma factor [unclassified Rhodococcus (in: high G+C Gram-positive bacteria)]OZC48464.1 hypothetical protein CH289_18910 [Rhodococcus sp. RS1C4]
MDLQYLSRVLMQLKPFIRDGAIRRTRLERVLGTLQVSTDVVRPEIERLLAKAGFRVVEDAPEPTDSKSPDAAGTFIGAADAAGAVGGSNSPFEEAPQGERRVIATLEAETAIAAAERQIAEDGKHANQAKVLLTAQQEVGLSLLIRERKQRPLEQGEFGRLSGTAREAAECLFLHNQGLIHSIARKFPQNGMTYDDLFQYGCVGLIRAVEMFDPAQGNKFSTYATWWIRQSITRGVANDARLIRLPVHMVEKLRKVWLKRELLTVDGHPPSVYELARECEFSEKEVMECLKLGPPDLPSLDMKIGDSEATLADILDLEDSEMSPYSHVERALLEDSVQVVLETLSEREAGVISKRFGFNGEDEMTLEEIGKVYGVTRERIRQIEKKAMAKLQDEGRLYYLKSVANGIYWFPGSADRRTSASGGSAQKGRAVAGT